REGAELGGVEPDVGGMGGPVGDALEQPVDLLLGCARPCVLCGHDEFLPGRGPCVRCARPRFPVTTTGGGRAPELPRAARAAPRGGLPDVSTVPGARLRRFVRLVRILSKNASRKAHPPYPPAKADRRGRSKDLRRPEWSA